MDIPRQTKDSLKTLVRDYVAGQVLFSSQVPEGIVSMVFLPVMMGGLRYPVEEPSLPAEPPKPVRDFTRPKRPTPDVGSVTEPLRVTVAEARATLDKVEFKARWSEASESDVDVARAALTRAEAALVDAEALAGRAADEAHGVLLTEYRAKLAVHRAEISRWRGEMKAWREACAGLQPAVDAWKAGKDVYFDKLSRELGVIYGYHKDAIGTRGINGFPMLGMCSLLHREDWELVKRAIHRELDREIEL
jgi:hypothetical protein